MAVWPLVLVSMNIASWATKERNITHVLSRERDDAAKNFLRLWADLRSGAVFAVGVALVSAGGIKALFCVMPVLVIGHAFVYYFYSVQGL